MPPQFTKNKSQQQKRHLVVNSLDMEGTWSWYFRTFFIEKLHEGRDFQNEFFLSQGKVGKNGSRRLYYYYIFFSFSYRYIILEWIFGWLIPWNETHDLFFDLYKKREHQKFHFQITTLILKKKKKSWTSIYHFFESYIFGGGGELSVT